MPLNSYFNEEQQDHMRSLARIPPAERCASGWHVLERESCDCERSYGFQTLAARQACPHASTKEAVFDTFCNDCKMYVVTLEPDHAG